MGHFNKRGTFHSWRLDVLAVFLSLSPCWASAISVTLTAKTEGGSKPTVVGTTNLPAGTSLMVSLSRKESAYQAQSKASVAEDGTFKTEQFSFGGRELHPGVYSIEVMTPIAAVQSDSVASTMGSDGSKLEGPLVVKSSFGGKIIEFKTKVKIGSGVGSASSDKAARVQTQANKHAWWLQSCKDTCGMTAKSGLKFDVCYARCAADEPVAK